MMDTIFISKRVINDVVPIMRSKKYTKYIEPEVFLVICELFYHKIINNIKFRKLIEKELEATNQEGGILKPTEQEIQEVMDIIK